MERSSAPGQVLTRAKGRGLFSDATGISDRSRHAALDGVRAVVELVGP
jgi:hypothetical protein